MQTSYNASVLMYYKTEKGLTSMFEAFGKMTTLCNEVVATVPRERLDKLIDKILVKPVSRAMKKLEKDQGVADTVKEGINGLLDKISPENLPILLMMSLAEKEPQKLADVEKFILELPDALDVKVKVDRFLTAIENNAVALGNIVEKIILVSCKIKDEAFNDDESNLSDKTCEGT